MIDENLVGYLLNALDSESQREVEQHLRLYPDAQKRLESLRRALEPLAADREAPEPPLTLRVRTLARVAEYRCSEMTPIPKAPPIRSVASARSRWWRRADVLVAACLLLILLPLALPGIAYVRYRQNILACQNNLRGFSTGLTSYIDHHGRLPEIGEQPPLNFAGMVIPVLHEEGFLGRDLSVACPSNGRRPPSDLTVKALETISAERPGEFDKISRELCGCYAYSLGYRDDEGCLCGPYYDRDNLPYLAIMADRPPFEQISAPGALMGNSPNHGQQGQNVLYLDGHVHFRTSRNVGVKGDDIYLNRDGVPVAGLDRLDTVLGASNFRPSILPPKK
jgi:prepilin-type processing-associated H-X9-DG protein